MKFFLRYSPTVYGTGPCRKMIRLPRPKLLAEFAIFLFVATTLIYVALHFSGGNAIFYHINAYKALGIEATSSSPEIDTFLKNENVSGQIDSTDSSLGISVATERKVVSLLGNTADSRINKPSKGEINSRSSGKVDTSFDHSLSRNNPLQNISKPYYTIVTDEVLEIDRTYFRLRPTRISTIPDRYIITSRAICQPDSPSILFVIPSVATAQVAAERFEIRRTWASDLYDPTYRQASRVRLVFFFGSLGLTSRQLDFLKEESQLYRDIVVGEFLDSYKNLSLKMAVTLTWVAQNCPNIKAAVKIDMDTYVNVKLLLKLIDQLPSDTHPKYVFGHQHGARQPVVVREGAWAVPASLYPFSKFPRYIYGHSYVISGAAVKLMAKGFPFFPIVPNEDAFATGIVPVTLNITRFNHEAFAYLLEKRTLCQMTSGKHVTGVMRKENRIKLWMAFQTKVCVKEGLNSLIQF